MYVYAIGQTNGEGPVKIGISSDTQSRLAAIQTSYPYQLRVLSVSEWIPQARSVEARIHRFFEDFRLNGEWFNITHEVAVKWIENPFQNEIEKEDDEEDYILKCGTSWAIHDGQDLCRAVADIRHSAGMTQEELSELACIERTYLAKLEKGEGTKSIERTIRALRRMGAVVSIYYKPQGET